MTVVGVGTFVEVRTGFVAAFATRWWELLLVAVGIGLLCASILLTATTARRLPPTVLFVTMLNTAGISVLVCLASLRSDYGAHAMLHLYKAPARTLPSDYWILAAMGAVICINIGLVLAWMLANAEHSVD